MDVVTTKVEDLSDLRKLLHKLRVEKGANDDEIAHELEQLGVQPTGWTAFRVRCLTKSLRVHRKAGRKTAAEEASRFIEREGRPQVKSKQRKSDKRQRRQPREYVAFDDSSTGNPYGEVL